MISCLLSVGPALVTLIVVGAVVLILRLLIPTALGWLGLPAFSLVFQVIDIILKAVVLILVVYFVFTIIACLVGAAPSFGLRR